MEFKHKPLDHQMEEWLTSRESAARALFWEMGTGKSKVIIDTAAWLYLKGKLDVVVIVAKKGEYTNWKHVEIPEHMPVEVPHQCEVYRSGLRAHEKESIRKLAAPGDRLRILCINVETLNVDERKRFTSEGGKVAAGIAKTAKAGLMFVVDESTCVKSHKASRSKGAQKIAGAADYRRILSGTPVPHSPLDLWGQSLILGQGLLRHKTFTSYRAEYAEMETVTFGSRSFQSITGFRKLDQLQKVVKTFGSIKERADCMDLPPKIYKKIVVPMTDRQESLYEEMRDLAMARLGDGEIVEATNALGVLSRLDQIACGQLRKEDGSFEIIESDRPEFLLNAVTASPSKGIVWCNYRGLLEYVYELMRKELGPENVGRYYGGVPDDERELTLAEFQGGSKMLWIVANQQSLGYGRTLTRGKENYYFSNGYNLEHRLQSEDRTMRFGQHDPVLYGDFLAPGTVNEKIFVNLRNKRNMAVEVLGTRLRDWI